MEVLSSSATNICLIRNFPIKSPTRQTQVSNSLHVRFKLSNSPNKKNQSHNFNHSSFYHSSSSSIYCVSSSTARSASSTPGSSTSPPLLSTASGHHHWVVVMEKPQGVDSKPEIIDYYVKTLERVLGSEKDAQMCIYDASWDTHFGFCCDVDEETSRELACLPGVLSVRPDLDFNSANKDYGFSMIHSGNLSNLHIGSPYLFPAGSSKHWLVRMDKPGVGVVTKAQMVDFYVQILSKVLGNEKDAQMCIYHISWQSNFGFCCELDEECARELVGVPGVMSVQLDTNFGSENKDYGGDNLRNSSGLLDSAEANQSTNIGTKKLFVTGLSFYTSEKTLRAAFEGFGQLVEVKIIMDKISKRSKGYAFIEYTTEEAASAALKEMNGKVINGWMIVVDVAKKNPPKYSRGSLRSTV
ncbi:organelle RRM domain-containing protein 1, chloroplastic [Malania oleifera]|uniref:organelle RRM domain-containing protein 1, chloroplastic n=1 Tax=Malania oleifera TaxID=397392 RepID=UPI0025ADC8AA|nr:organelle RRM domain-containing protein 1, chloroplastic [Malania oleifera]